MFIFFAYQATSFVGYTFLARPRATCIQKKSMDAKRIMSMHAKAALIRLDTSIRHGAQSPSLKTDQHSDNLFRMFQTLRPSL
jgi:hypothetical protein